MVTPAITWLWLVIMKVSFVAFGILLHEEGRLRDNTVILYVQKDVTERIRLFIPKFKVIIKVFWKAFFNVCASNGCGFKL